MARRKTGDYHMRVDVDNRREWECCARELDMSLACWLECLANREVLARRQARLLRKVYPNRPDLRGGA